MAADGTPEPAAQRCGAAVARLRTLRKLSRAQLVARLCDELAPTDRIYEQISMPWLARLENGRIVKVARPTIEALCRALRCTHSERAWLLLHADRNVLTDGEPSETAKLLTYAVDQLHRDAGETLAALLGPRQACALDELERLQLTAAVLEIAISQLRDGQAAQRAKHGNDTLRASAQTI
jgi:transcriptional regulator with XRE-family HTH domain